MNQARTSLAAIAFVLALGAGAGPAHAEDAAAATSAAAAPPVTEGAQVFAPDFFARFSPRNALDMVAQIPGFQIRDGNPNNGGGQQRGLGQANTNVLVNGQRLASKSEGVREQLARIPSASVVRIELVDGAALAIPGLSGQVANIVSSSSDSFSGQFRWRGVARAHYAEPSFLGGEVSIKGASGPFEYTASLSNEPDRGAFGGPYAVLDGSGTVIENRDGNLHVEGENPKLAAGVKFDGPGSSVGNLNASYRRTYFDFTEEERRDLVAGDDYFRTIASTDRGYDYEISGDYEFDLGPGRLKLIGLERYNRGTFDQYATYAFADGRPDEGDRYTQTVGQGEHIARGEYSWKMWKADMQLAVEAAFNRLDKEASLFGLEPDGSYSEIAFPGGNGGVTEDRYETILTMGQPLLSNLTLQAGLGWEYSKISQTGTANATREFWRPKGSATLAWAPEAGLDVTLKVERRVGQLQFGDFLARVFLENGNENAVNADLVPEQSWDSDLTIKKAFGKWGSSQLRLFHRRTEDFVDVIPVEGGGEARGNIPLMQRLGLEWTSTLNLDPVGIKGAKIDLNVIAQRSKMDDPLTGEERQLSGLTTRLVELNYRHDVAGTQFAYGADFFHRRAQPFYRVYEWAHDNEGPVFAGVFVEHKDVMGLTVNARIDNIFGAKHQFYRVVYDGPRDTSDIAFIEDQDRKIGPIFRLSVSGSF